jgi:hypothetical protein
MAMPRNSRRKAANRTAPGLGRTAAAPAALKVFAAASPKSAFSALSCTKASLQNVWIVAADHKVPAATKPSFLRRRSPFVASRPYKFS